MSRLQPLLIEPLEARIAPAANIVLGSVVANVPTVVAPGETGTVTFEVKNTGDETFKDTEGIHLWLSADTTLGGGDVFLAEFEDQPFNLGVNKSKFVKKSFTIPELNLSSPEFPAGNAFILVQLPQEGLTKASQGFTHVFKFGTFEGHKDKGIKVTDGDTEAGFNATGGGYGEFTISGGIVNLDFHGGTTKTKAGTTKGVPKGGDGLIVLNNVTADSPLGDVPLKGVQLTGNASFPSGITGLRLDKAGGIGKSITVGGSGNPVNFVLDQVTDLNLTSAPGIKILKVESWVNVGEDKITAPFIGKIDAGGDFGASLELNGADANSRALGSAKVDGKIQNGTWTIIGANHDIQEIKANGAISWKLVSDGSVGKILMLSDVTGGDLKAVSFKTIGVKGNLNAKIVATGDQGDKEKTGIEKIVALSMGGSTIEAAAAGIETIDIGDWLGGSLKTQWVENLLTDGKGVGSDGNFTPTVTLTGRGSGTFEDPVLKKAVFAGVLGGTWNITRDISSLTAAEIGSTFHLTGVPSGIEDTDIFDLEVKGKDAGVIDVAHLGNVEVKGDFVSPGKFIMHSGFGAFDLAFAKVAGGAIDCAGIITKMTALNWDGGDIKAQQIETMTVTGGSPAKLAGDLKNLALILTGDASLGGITKLTVHGTIANAVLSAPNQTIAKITAADWSGGSLIAADVNELNLIGSAKGGLRGDMTTVNVTLSGGSATKLDIAGFVQGTSEIQVSNGGIYDFGGMTDSKLTSSGDIGLFVIRGIKDITNAFQNSTVKANAIATVIVNDAFTGNGTAYGFDVDKIDTYSRFLGGDRIEGIPTSFDAPGDFDVDGAYRVHVR